MITKFLNKNIHLSFKLKSGGAFIPNLPSCTYRKQQKSSNERNTSNMNSYYILAGLAAISLQQTTTYNTNLTEDEEYIKISYPVRKKFRVLIRRYFAFLIDYSIFSLFSLIIAYSVSNTFDNFYFLFHITQGILLLFKDFAKIGKNLLKLKILNEKNTSPSNIQLVIRNLDLFCLSLLAALGSYCGREPSPYISIPVGVANLCLFLSDIISLLYRKESKTLGDIVANTKVVVE